MELRPPNRILSKGAQARHPLSVLGTTLYNLTFQDVVATCFHLYMLARISIAPASHEQLMGQRFALTLLTITACTVVAVRGEVLRPGRFRAFFYRLGIFTPVVVSYFEMRFVLQGIQPDLVDLELYALDRALLGGTPALMLERFNQVPIIEWFGFFYYSYFYLMAALFLPTLFVDRGRRMRELMVGGVVVATCGHMLYTLVPGAGPHATLQFSEPIRGGFFWGQILETVERGGAHLDIFPSLHTAYPTLFTLHCFAHRDKAPFKYVWPIVALFAVHMIGATMLLRWHWFIDVVAGLGLALASRGIGVAVATRETERGDRQAVWEPLFRFQQERDARSG